MSKLFVVSGIMRRGERFEVLCGIYQADAEEQAQRAHVYYMERTKPNWEVHESPVVFQVPDEFVLQAAANLKKGIN